MRFRSLQSRLTCYGLVLILLLLVLITAATYSWFKHQTARLIFNQQLTLVTTTADGLDDKLFSAHTALQRVAAVFPQQYRFDRTNAQRWLNNRTGIRSIFTDGLYLITPDSTVLAENVEAGLHRDTLLSANHGLPADCFTTKACISEPYRCADQGHASIMMTAPISAADGNVAAVLVGSINIQAPDSFFQTLVSRKIGASGYLFLVDQQHTVVAHPDRPRIMQKTRRSFQEFLASIPSHENAASVEMTNIYGVPSIISFKNLHATSLVVVSVVPQHEAYAPINGFRNVLIPGAVIIMLIAAAAIWRVTHATTAGLEKLTASIEQIDPKNLSETELVVVKTGDEVERLAGAFNALLSEAGAAQKQILQGQERLRSITESTPNGIIMVDAAGMITFWNPSATTIFGYGKEETLGQELLQLLVPERDRAVCKTFLAGLAATGQGPAVGKSTELTALHRDGREISISLALSSFRLDGVWHAVGIIRDISDLKQYQRDLIEARHAAEAANQAKSQFLANMSHEIRTPLNGVLGMTQLLQFTQPTEEQKEFIGYLEQSGKNLLALLNDILDLSRIEAGKMNLEQTGFSLQDCIDDIVATQLPQIRQKTLQLDITLPDTLPRVLVGDPLRLKQILLNLLANAVKFTPTGTIAIKVTITAQDSAAIVLLLEVSDTGFGMDDETLARIFSPFEQADNSNTRLYGGSGLGLTICRRLAEMMGGSIWAESVFGQGSTFYVELSFGVAQISQAVDHQADHSAQVVSGSKSLKILVTDDNRLNADTLVAMLKKMGHSAEIATNGKEALDRWHAAALDCILMDISMPVMDGCQATATIREQEQKIGGHTPIIALTAHAQLGDRERFLASGFDGYVSKPVIMDQLYAVLAEVVRSAHER